MPPAAVAAVLHLPLSQTGSSFVRGDEICLVSFLFCSGSHMNRVLRIFNASSSGDIEEARKLFREYEAGLGISLCFQNFEQELANLPGDYKQPDGRLFLCEVNERIAGCIALRKLEPGICEMKRLYVRQDFRGQGLGKALVTAVIYEAARLGYERMRLDTLPGRMDDAIVLYRSFGFKEIDPYYQNPAPETLYMELALH